MATTPRTPEPRVAWEAYASTIAPALADAIEENAVELGLAEDTDAFFVECIAQLAAELDR